MKILMQSRKNFFSLPGGDTVQLNKTKENLEKMGVEVDFDLDFDVDLSDYDIVHLSNVTRIQETYLQMKNAKKQNKPVVLSTIFWPMDEFEKMGQKGVRKIIGSLLNIDNEERLKAIARYIKDPDSRNEATKNLWKIGYREMQKYVIENADFFLPNSEMEMDEFSKYFNVPKEKYIVVPNAIDKDIALEQMDKPVPDEFKQYEGYVICVGRIETRKNQLSLLKALDETGLKVLLVGKPSSNQPGYFKEVKDLIDKNPNYKHIEGIDNKDLYSLYKVCRVSALPSWLDTPGLVSLEAGAMGCNLAVSIKGSTREYYLDYAEYCEPDNLDSIKKAVVNAYNKEKTEGLRSRILKMYTWENAAVETLKCYKNIMRKL